MRMFATLLFLFFATCAASAQSAHRVIIWGGDNNCGFKSKTFAETDVVTCGSVQTERGSVNTITLNGIGLAVAFLEDDKYEIVAAKITNTTAAPVMFDSDSWGAAHFKSMEDYAKGRRPIVAETSIPTRDLIRSSSRRVSMADSVEEFMADSTMTSEVREVRRPDGTRVRRTVIVPDKAAREAAASQGQVRADAAAGEMRRIRSTALTAKTVPADGFVKGLVYFRRIKKAGFRLFSFTVDGTFFVFRLRREQT